jgi:hypothetical protein
MLPTFGAPLLFHSLYISLRFTSLYVYCTVHTSIYCKLYSSNMYNCIELIIINHMSIYFFVSFYMCVEH